MFESCLTARQELSRQRIGLAIPDNSDTHDCNAGRCPASTRPQDCATARPARQRRCSSGSAGYSNECTGGGVTSCTVAASVQDRRHGAAASVEDKSLLSYRLHSGGSGGGLETSRGGACGGPGSVDIEGARSRSHGPAAERPELGLGEPESTHCWTGTTCRAAPIACSDWMSLE